MKRYEDCYGMVSMFYNEKKIIKIIFLIHRIEN